MATEFDDDLFDVDLFEEDDDDLLLLDPEAGTFQSPSESGTKSTGRAKRSRDLMSEGSGQSPRKKGERTAKDDDDAPSRGAKTVLIILIILVVGVAAVLGIMQATGGEPLKFIQRSATTEEVQTTTPAAEETAALPEESVPAETAEVTEPAESETAEAEPWNGEGLALMETVADSFTMNLVEVDNLGRIQSGGNHQVDATIASDLEDFLDAAHAAGYGTMLSTCYRDDTTEESALDVQEHSTGLAVDLVDVEAQMKEVFAQEQTDQIQWLADNAAEYGFILRFPEGKEDLTGSEYIPYHFVYVGKSVAQDMASDGLCLEEYLAQ